MLNHYNKLKYLYLTYSENNCHYIKLTNIVTMIRKKYIWIQIVIFRIYYRYDWLAVNHISNIIYYVLCR